MMRRNASDAPSTRPPPSRLPASDTPGPAEETGVFPAVDRLTRSRFQQCGVDKERIRTCDLSELNLAQADLSGIDLRGFILSKVNIERANLRGADLRCVSFTSASCVEASFVGADLRGASLAFGYFSSADFSGADMRGALLTDAHCSDCIFAGSDLRGASLGIDLVGADFRGADLRGAVFPDAFDFDKLGCDIRGALLTPSRMTSAENRRRSQRTHLREPLRVFERKMMQVVGAVVEISPDGMRMMSPRAIPLENTLSLRIELPVALNRGPSVDIDAHSVWCRFNDGLGTYLSGFRISRISHGGGEIIQDLMRSFAKNSTDFFGDPAPASAAKQ